MGKITRFTVKQLCFLLLLSTGIAGAQIINIPDANFKNALVNTNCAQIPPQIGYTDLDANNDGEIEVSEVSMDISILNIQSANISSLEGIQNFTYIGELHCENNNLTTLNLFGMPNLDALYCAHNSMTSLIISNSNIKAILCNDNLLTHIDFNPTTPNGNYDGTMDLSNNLLTSIDLPPYLEQFDTLNISGNLITTFSVACTQLQNFICNNNPNLISLDFSGVNRLFNKVITNNSNLQYINFKNGWVDFCDSNLSYPGGCQFTDSSPVLSNNPSLQFICADEQDLEGIPASIGAQSVAYSSYCNFIPGGTHNSISGNILFDADNNGCDSNDMPQSGIRINVNGGALYTTSGGNYTFYTGQGSTTFTPGIENPTFFNFSPPTATVSFLDNNNNTAIQNFCITANGIRPDIEVVIAPIIPARPGFDAIYEIVFKNKGNQVLSGNVIFNYDDSILDFVSASTIPDSQSVGTLNWNYTNLMPFENRSFHITLNVNSPVETPAVNVNDILNFIATANPNTNDESPADNVFELHQTVVGAIDPNEKQCIEGNSIEPSEIGKYLHYIIHFENLGTAAAENIVVKDIIDTTMFDINSLQVINSSDPVNVKITGNMVEFIFENLNLPIGGHGNVLFKIKTLPTLVPGSEVANTANIFFDYNAPVETNEARTAFANLSNKDFTKDNSIVIYPNPAKNNISITAKSNIQSVQLFDVQGRILHTAIENKAAMTLDISNQQSGIYFVKITTQDGTATEKIIKE